jgi:hypothetical protein
MEYAQVMRITPTERDDKPWAIAPTSPAGTLDVVEWFRGHVPQEHGVKVAQVHTEFECSRGAKDVDLALPKLALKGGGGVVLELRRMLFDSHARGQVCRGVQQTIVVCCNNRVIRGDTLKAAWTIVCAAQSGDVLRMQPTTHATTVQGI